MFSLQHPRTTARAAGKGRRVAASITAIALGGAFALAGTGTANAADRPTSWAEGRILSGSVLGIDLDRVAALAPAQASNNGSQATQTSKDPLDATVLDTVEVGPTNVQGNLGGVVQLGAVGQYAQAQANGSSYGASGAVMDDGAIGLGQDKAVPGTNATVDLNALLGDEFTSTLVDLDLAIGALGAQAKAEGASATGGYTLAGLKLNLSSPAISKLTDKVNDALDAVEGRLAVLDGADGLLALDLNGILQKISPSLNLLGGAANVTASINAGDLHKLVQDLLKTQYGEEGVTFNLDTGVVTIDLDKLAGGGLNNAAPGTEVLTSAYLDPILDSITGKVSKIADQVVDRVRAALHDATVEIHANVDLDVAQSPLVQKICNTVKTVIQVPTHVLEHVTIQVPVVDGVIAQVVNGVPVVHGVPIVGDVIGTTLGGILGGTQHTVTWITQTVTKTVTKLVNKTVDKLVCNNKVTALPALKTSADVDITGTVDEFLDGAGVDASAKVKVLGIVNTSLNLGLASDLIGDSLGQVLFDGDGAVQKLTETLDATLVDPAVEGLLDGDDAVGIALTDLLSVTINNQSLNDGTFTETALRVSVLGGSGAVINLASASVGPNVTDVENPCVVDCGVGGVTTTPPTGGVGGLLAMTGAGIALLVALVLALLAAGAYLVREGYRRRHPAVPAE
ncbi:MAG: choice-of-anchor family protein [Schumannella sp.]|nr:choice-of-anchor family protein [Schumannella sp.]